MITIDEAKRRYAEAIQDLKAQLAEAQVKPDLIVIQPTKGTL